MAGAESALLILIPLTFNDGEKIWSWNKLVWLALAVPSTFLFVHVLLNNSDFGALAEEVDTLTLLLVCAAMLLLSLATWLFFWRRARQHPA